VITIDQPVWRADLFDRLDGTPGAFQAAHFHPHFVGVEPCPRHWAEQVKAAPWDWLRSQLSDVADIVSTAGLELNDPITANEQVGAEVDAIVAAAQTRAATQCRSKQQCYAWTRDAQVSVHTMLDTLARPDLLDRDRVSPWVMV
jgi:hypothetical protein